VTFHYKPDIDSDGTPQFGSVAEEVEKVNPDLVAHDEKGQAYTVRYEAVQHRKMQEQERKMHEQEANIAQLQSLRLRSKKGWRFSLQD
jgi:hypothetical protein